MRKILFLLLILVSQSCYANNPVILISIDGFAQHYLDKYQPKNILSLANSGVIAEAMYPIFPSKTFPNHLSIVTGVYPAEHGIVHNKFYHRKIGQEYSLGAGKQNSNWLTATPIWTLAEQRGIKTGVYFWPESEATVAGILPTYFFSYKHNTPNRTRVNQVVDWLKLPQDKRPQFVATYFSTVDSAGHEFGINSIELERAIKDIDIEIGHLVDRLKKEVSTPVNILLVSDHGMTTAGKDNAIQHKIKCLITI